MRLVVVGGGVAIMTGEEEFVGGVKIIFLLTDDCAWTCSSTEM